MLLSRTTSKPERSNSTAKHAKRRGLSLVEVLICASLGSMLLTAVGMAFRASFNSYKDAQQRGQMVNSVRGLVARMAADVRMCDSALPYDNNLVICNAETSQFKSGTVPGNPVSGYSATGGSGSIGIQLLKTHADSWDPTASSANPILITYWYDNTTQQIWMTRQPISGATVQAQSVCKFVQSLQIYLLPYPNPVNDPTTPFILKRASITVTLANKDASGNRLIVDAGQDQTLTLTDSAAPRKTFPGY